MTQVQHAQQAAEQAREEGHPPHVLVGALLHDIGDLDGRGDCKEDEGRLPLFKNTPKSFDYISGHLVGLEKGLPAMTEGGQVRKGKDKSEPKMASQSSQGYCATCFSGKDLPSMAMSMYLIFLLWGCH